MLPIGQKLLDSLADTWDFFFCDVLSMLQAIFYPVQVHTLQHVHITENSPHTNLTDMCVSPGKRAFSAPTRSAPLQEHYHLKSKTGRSSVSTQSQSSSIYNTDAANTTGKHTQKHDWTKIYEQQHPNFKPQLQNHKLNLESENTLVIKTNSIFWIQLHQDTHRATFRPGRDWGSGEKNNTSFFSMLWDLTGSRASVNVLFPMTT